MKAFSSGRDCQVRLTFPNGNTVSTIWGFESYSDNNSPNLDEWDGTKLRKFSKVGFFHKYRESTTAEAMYNCDDATQKVIDARFPEADNPIGYMNINDWFDLITILKGEQNGE